jgi:Ulp1 protease family, C-terminal catalytic domain
VLQAVFAPWRVFATAQHKTMSDRSGKSTARRPTDNDDVRCTGERQQSHEESVATAVKLVRDALPVSGAWWMGSDSDQAGKATCPWKTAGGRGFYLPVALTGGHTVRRGGGHWVLTHIHKEEGTNEVTVQVLDPFGTDPCDELKKTVKALVCGLSTDAARPKFVNAFKARKIVHQTDGTSCGVFVCLYAWLASCGLKPSSIGNLPRSAVGAACVQMRSTVADAVIATLAE